MPAPIRTPIALSDFAVIGEDESVSPLVFFGAFNPCLVAAGPVAVPINRRRRGGTATLCGMSEYASPSTPPKKYRTQQLLNGPLFPPVTGCSYTPGCAMPGGLGGFAYSWQGAIKYDVATCAVTNTSEELSYGSDGVTDCGYNPTPIATSPMAYPFVPSNTSTAIQTLTQQTDRWDYPNTCSVANQKFDGFAVAQLVDEDTEADAIARLQATTAWIPAVGFSTCATPPTCCLADWEPRVAGFSFDWTEAQWSINATGLPANRLVCGAVDIFRRVYGVPPYVLYETIFVFGSTDGAGNLALTGDVPNDRGFETYFDNPRYFPPP